MNRMKISISVVLLLLVAHNSLASSAPPGASQNAQRRKFHLKLHHTGDIDIPGLYDDHGGLITPIQGREHFDRLVFGSGLGGALGSASLVDCNATQLKALAQNQTISLVQFYMATCPDCQGFSGYFKRFAGDIAPHWRKLVRIYTVNCNDFNNIHLCQEENPKLIVPMVRWYALPLLQASGREPASCCKYLNYSKSLLNIAHRKFIEKQRRDLVSLRRATLKYIDLMLSELAAQKQALNLDESLYNWLPLRWHMLKQLGAPEGLLQLRQSAPLNSTELLIEHMQTRRLQQCEAKGSAPHKNVIVFEHHPSAYSMGRTAVADWSNWTLGCNLPKCATNATTLLLVHWSSDFYLLKRVAQNMSDLPVELRAANATIERLTRASPVSVLFECNNTGDQLHSQANCQKVRFLAANLTTGAQLIEAPQEGHRLTRRHAAAQQTQRLGRVSQRASLERFYSQSPSSLLSQPAVRYAANMAGSAAFNARGKRWAQQQESIAPSEQILADQRQAEAEHINWAPELLWPRVELARYELNKAIASELELSDWPGKQFAGQNQGELGAKQSSGERGEQVEAKDDDLTLMLLTDYYKALDEIVHVDLIAKGQLDGYQLLGGACFLGSLVRHFPFQGNAQVPPYRGVRSLARYYLDLVRQRWLGELALQLKVQSSLLVGFNNNSSSSFCGPLSELERHLVGNSSSLASVSLSTRKLEQLQQEARKSANVGLAPSNKLSWKYCAGSEPNLRGHTCSLWILFHTLTVHEYLERLKETSSVLQENATIVEEEKSQIYQYQIDYRRTPRRQCDPSNPENAYLDWPSKEHYVTSTNSTMSVLANIINFVRFYLPCTNCAAHFSCMVEHSQDLQFDLGGEPDLHLLWLWEGHNRVNLRTRGTHSEDSMRPKHVFPVYEACPECYQERPTLNATKSLDTLKFNKRELVKFIVARYRKSAILNNKVNIEDLYRDA